MLDRKQIIVLNKTDLVDEDVISNLKSKFDTEVYEISAVNQTGVNVLLDKVILELDRIPVIVKR